MLLSSISNSRPTRRSSGARPEAGEPLNFTLGIQDESRDDHNTKS